MSFKFVHAIISELPCVSPVHVGRDRKGCRGEGKAWASPGWLGGLRGGEERGQSRSMERGMRTDTPKPSVTHHGLHTH